MTCDTQTTLLIYPTHRINHSYLILKVLVWSVLFYTFNHKKGRQTPGNIQNRIFLQQKKTGFGAGSTYATKIMST